MGIQFEGISAVTRKITDVQNHNFTVIINDLDSVQLMKSLRTDVRMSLLSA